MARGSKQSRQKTKKAERQEILRFNGRSCINLQELENLMFIRLGYRVFDEGLPQEHMDQQAAEQGFMVVGVLCAGVTGITLASAE